MAGIKQVGKRIQLTVDTLDGGRNVHAAPSRISDTQSPDQLNVVYDDQGSCGTRQGTSYFNTSIVEVGSAAIDGIHNYNGTMVIWANGGMYRASSTTFVPVTTASGQFTSGAKVAYITYEDQVFCSDGTNGPFRWGGGENFYNAGLGTASAPTALSDAAGNIAADTYYYAVSFINSAAVESAVGSTSVGVTIGASATIRVSEIPVGSGLYGVDKRNVYRATAAIGPWKFVQELANNVATSFTDTIAVGLEGGAAPLDSTEPTPFTTVESHRERLFFDDSNNRTFLRYTEYLNPYVSKALNFEPLQKGDESLITAIGVQQNLVTIFKDKSTWVADLTDPSDDSTFVYEKTPINMGIIGPRAFVEMDNGIIFVGKRNGRVTGIHFLSGTSLYEANNRLLQTRNIAENIEDDLFSFTTARASDIAMTVFENRIYMAGPKNGTSTLNEAIWWFDINRISDDGQPGSWSLWTGDLESNDFTVFNGVLYGCSALADGYVRRFNNGTYTDADGAGIDSYCWTKQFGGESTVESYVKDMRYLNLWYSQLGAYNMHVRFRADGDNGVGDLRVIDLTPPADVWNGTTWGGGLWGSGGDDKESQISLGRLLARRVQFKFENERVGGLPVAGQGFKVYRFKMLMNLRRTIGNI